MSDHQNQAQPSPIYLRLQEVIRNRTPGYNGILPMSIPAWYAGMAAGKFPKPVRLGKMAMYRKSDIDALIARMERGELAGPDPLAGARRGRPRKAVAGAEVAA